MGKEIASQSLAMTRSGKWGSYSGDDPEILVEGRGFVVVTAQVL